MIDQFRSFGSHMEKSYNPTFWQKSMAWAVHVFTASGLLSAFMALVAIDNGDWKACWLWLLLCLLIDGIDGTFARMAKVSVVLPQIEGKYIDYVIDFATYAIIPAFFFYKVGMTSEALMPYAIGVMLLSAALYYGKSDMTGGEAYFVGFPVLWNVVVFALFFIVNLDPIWSFVVVLIFGVLHFVPLKYAYPSQAKRFFWGHMVASFLAFVTPIAVLYYYPEVPDWSRYVILGVMLWFFVTAVIETFDVKSQEE